MRSTRLARSASRGSTRRSAPDVGAARACATCSTALLPETGAVEVLFTGLDRGVEGGEEQDFQRSLPLDLARDDDVILAYDLNGAPLPPQHGSPLRLLVPGWYGMTNVKWLARITLVDEPFRGLPAGARLPLPRRRGRPRRPAAAHPARVR